MKPRQSSVGPKNRSSRPSGRVSVRPPKLEVVSDREGAAVYGWAASGVVYTRFDGGLSAEAGQAYATRLSALVKGVSAFTFFCDSSQLKYYDLLARSAFVRAILANRRRLSSLVFLTWAEGVSPITRALAEAVGEPMEILTDLATFESRLLRSAPHILRKIDSIPRLIAVNEKKSVE